MIDYLRTGIESLIQGQGAGATVLNADIPFINQSLNDLTGLRSVLRNVLDLLPPAQSGGSDIDLDAWLDDVANTAGLPSGFLSLEYSEDATFPGRWVVDINVNFDRIVQDERAIDIVLGDFGDLGPISGSALDDVINDDGINMQLRVDGAAQLNLDLQLIGQGLLPVELRMLESSELSVGAGLRLSQTTEERLGLSAEVADMLNTLADSSSFSPQFDMVGGSMWLSSNAEAQTQTLALKRRDAGLTASTFNVGQLVTSGTGSSYSAAAAKFGIVKSWNHETGVLELLAPSAAISGGNLNVFTSADKIATVDAVTGEVSASGSWKAVMSVNAPEGQDLRVDVDLGVTGIDISRMLANDDRIAAFDANGDQIWVGDVTTTDMADVEVGDTVLLVNTLDGDLVSAATDTTTFDRVVEFEDGSNATMTELTLANVVDSTVTSRTISEITNVTPQADLSIRYRVTFESGTTDIPSSMVGGHYVDQSGRWFRVDKVEAGAAWITAIGHTGAPLAGGELYRPFVTFTTNTNVDLGMNGTVQRVSGLGGAPIGAWLEDLRLLPDANNAWFEIVSFNAVSGSVDLRPLDLVGARRQRQASRVSN